MRDSKIETNDNGKPYLTVYYDRTAKDWDKAITYALERHGCIEGRVTVICKPEGKK